METQDPPTFRVPCFTTNILLAPYQKEGWGGQLLEAENHQWCGGSQGKVSQNLFALRSLPRDWISGERGPTATHGQLRQTAFTITSLTSIVVTLVMLLKPLHSPLVF